MSVAEPHHQAKNRDEYSADENEILAGLIEELPVKVESR